MGKIYDRIDDSLAAWMHAQPLWFVATAPLAVDSHVNMSPRGHDSFSVLDTYSVGWVDYTGIAWRPSRTFAKTAGSA